MATLASSGVTVIGNYTEGGENGKRFSVIEASVVLTSMGTSTNAIPASAFGLSKIVRATSLVKSDDTTGYATTPNVAQTKLLVLIDGGDVPGDVTGTFYLTVWGLQ